MRFSELTKKQQDLIKRVAAAFVLCALTALLIALASAGKLYGNEMNDAFNNIYAVEESAEES